MNEFDTQVWTVDRQQPDDEIMGRAAQIIADGGLVAFPTETVYGLGADALSGEAVDGIFRAKQRPATNPLIVHVANMRQARRLAATWSDRMQSLAEAFWPGPLTMVVQRSQVVPDAVCAGLETVALRMPSHPVARRLIELADTPIAAPSANRYTEVSPTCADHVVAGLKGRIDALIDAGPSEVGVESTLVSVIDTPAKILRPGIIDAHQLAKVVDIDDASRKVVAEEQARPSPGMSKQHYSPKTPLRLVDTDTFQKLEAASDGDYPRRAFIGCGPRRVEVKESTSGDLPPRLWLGDEPARYAHRLYASLHRLDCDDVDEIIVERPPDKTRWAAIRDRLQRAAAQ